MKDTKPLKRFLSFKAEESLRDYTHWNYDENKFSDYLKENINRFKIDDVENLELSRQIDLFEKYRKERSNEVTNAFVHFLNQEGRGKRRLIDIPDPAYKEGHSQLVGLLTDIIKTGHMPTIRAAMSSIEVDLDWLVEDVESFPMTQNCRQLRRMVSASEMVAAAIAKCDNAQQLSHNSTVSSIYGAANTVQQELVKYISKHPRILYDIKPRQFEEIIAEILTGFGWEVELTPETRDGGYDILAVSKDVDGSGLRSSYIVECKKYKKSRKVGIEVVRQLLQIKSEKAVSNAILVTSSDFTRGVYDYSINRLDLDLKNFEAVIEWCKAHKKTC